MTPPCSADQQIRKSGSRDAYHILGDTGISFNYLADDQVAFAMPADLFIFMVRSGAATATIGNPGVYTIGGILVRVIVYGASTAGAVLTSPVTLTIGGAAAVGTIGYWIYSSKADLRQVRDAATQVVREQGCRQPTNDDYEEVHEMIKDQKGPDGKVPYDVLLETWRQVLCR